MLVELPVRSRGTCCAVPIPIAPTVAVETARLLRALADPTRLSMVAALWRASAPVCICDFTATFALSQPTVSHHMAKLRAAGLVHSRRQGIWTYYQLPPGLPLPAERLLSALFGERTTLAKST